MVGVQHVREGRRDRTRPEQQPRGQRQRPRGDSTGAAARLLALLLGWCAATGGLGVVVAQAAGAVRAAGPARLEDAAALVAGGAALLAAWWLAVAVLASVWAAVLTRRRPDGVLARAAIGVARRTAPAGLRRAALLAVGLSLTGAAGPALAASRPAGPAAPPAACATAPCLDPGWGAGPAPSPAVQDGRTAPTASVPSRAVPTRVVTARPGAGDPAAATVTAPVPVSSPPARETVAAVATGSRDGSLDPGWVPRPPARTAAVRPQVTMPGAALRPRHAARDEVVVHAGDSLWTIVERYLGPHATAAQVAVEWPRWHAANRAVVGADPDRLLPGQVLRPPAPASARVRPPAAGAAGSVGPAAGGAR